MTPVIKAGQIFMHYKYKLYNVLGTVSLIGTKDEHVLYNSMHGCKQSWLRPKTMFLGQVDILDKKVPRFTFITDKFADLDHDKMEKYHRTLIDVNYVKANDMTEEEIKKQYYNRTKYLNGFLECLGKIPDSDIGKFYIGCATHTETGEQYIISDDGYKLIGIKCAKE